MEMMINAYNILAMWRQFFFLYLIELLHRLFQLKFTSSAWLFQCNTISMNFINISITLLTLILIVITSASFNR